MPRFSRRPARSGRPSRRQAKLSQRDWRRRDWRCGFELLEPLRMLNAVSWIGPATGGNWDTTADWSGLSAGETLPGSNDDVSISGNATVTHNSGADHVQSLTIGAGATLDITGGSTITVGNSTTAGAVSDDGAIDLGDAAGATFGSLFFNGNGTTLSPTSSASGTVVLGGNTNNELAEQPGFSQALTIAADITITGGSGTIGLAGVETLTNHGTIDANTAGGTIRVGLGTAGANSGTIEVTNASAAITVAGPGLQNAPSTAAAQWTNSGAISANGGTLNIDDSTFDPWTNTGTISSTAATVNLDGLFTQAGLGTFTRDAASTVNLTGDLIGNLALDSATGNWNLSGGEIGAPPIGSSTGGGTFSASGGATLFATAANSTLNAETLTSPIDFSTNNFSSATVVGGSLTLHNVTLDLGNTSGSTSANLFFSGVETLGVTSGGTSTIVMGGSTNNMLSQSQGFGQALTITQGITIEGDNGLIGGNNGGKLTTDATIDADTANGAIRVLLGTAGANSGTIEVTNASGTITVAGPGLQSDPSTTAAQWTNSGTIGATGGTLNIDDSPFDPWTNNGTISSTGATVNLDGLFTQADLGTFIRDTASTVNLTGDLIGNLALDGGTGNWNLAGGEIGAPPIGSTTGGGAFSANGATLFATAANSTLNAETLTSPIDFATNNFSLATVVGGSLTLHNVTLNLGNASGGTFANLFFSGVETLGATSGATGAIVLGGNTDNQLSQSQGFGPALTIAQGITVEGDNGLVGGNGSGTLINDGTITADTSGGTVTVTSGQVTNNGTLQAVAGTLAVNPAVGTLTNYSAGTLSGGTWQASGGGTLWLAGDPVTTDAANIAIDGAASGLTSNLRNAATVNALAGLSDIATTGSVTLTDGYILTTSGALANNGTLTLGAGATAACTLTVGGNYTQASGAALDVQIGGTPASVLFGQLAASGTSSGAALNGTLNASLANGFTPVANESFPLITTGAASGLTGTFATVNLPALSGGLAFTSQYNADNFTLATNSTALPTKLVFLQQPSNTTAGGAIDSPGGVQVEIVDQSGNVISSDTSNVTIAIASPAGGAFASGTLTEAAVHGVATFKDLVIDAAGSYALSASDSGDSLAGITSNSFTVNPAAASQLVFTAQPTNTLAGHTINGTSGVLVSIEDQFGNVETGDTSNVAIAIASPAGGAFASGTLTEAAVAGVATFNNLVIDTPGTYTLSAGDTDNGVALAAATSSSFTINALPTTATLLVSSANPSVFGQTVNFTATVSSTATGIPSGIVGFYDGTTFLGQSFLDQSPGDDAASIGRASLTVGSHSITAVYSGDGNFQGSTSTILDQTVNQAATGTTLVLSPNPSVAGQAVTFTATVTPTAPGAGTPTGTVFFEEGDARIGSAALQVVAGQDQATAQLTLDAAGVAAISAVYQGDGDFSGSRSAAVDQTVQPAAASQLVFTAQPTNTFAGQTINGTSGVQISIEDPFGNVETADGSSTMAMTVASGPGGFTSGSTTSVTVSGGVGAFTNLVLDTVGSYTLQAADGALNQTSAAFSVVPDVATWSGGGGTANENWSDTANWQNGIVPGAGFTVVFPTGVSQKISNDDLAATTKFAAIELDDGGYTITGNTIVLSGGITDTASGGDIIQDALTFNADPAIAVSNAGGSLTLGAIDNGGGTLQVGATGATGVVSGTLSDAGQVTIYGILEELAGTVDVQNGGTLLDVATVTLEAGSLLGGPPFATLQVDAGGTLQVGLFLANGPVFGTLNDAGQATIDGTLDEVGGTIDVQSGGALLDQGVVTVEAGATLTNQGTFTVQGTATSPAVLTADGTQTGPVTVGAGGTLDGTGSAGVITAKNGGTVAPGPAGGFGILHAVAADFAAGGVLRLPVSGYTAAGVDYGSLQLSREAILGGTSTLTLDLAGLGTPGSARGLALYASHTGTFTNLVAIDNTHLFRVRPSYSATSLNVAFAGSPLPNLATATILFVGDPPNVSNYFTSIQAAIDAARPGDVIEVAPGVYQENVVVNKPLFILGAQYGQDARFGRGEPAQESVLDGSFTVGSANVLLAGFTVSDPQAAAGVTVGRFANDSLFNNIVNDPAVGLLFNGSRHALATGNLIANNSGQGILIEHVHGDDGGDRPDGQQANDGSQNGAVPAVEIQQNLVENSGADGIAVLASSGVVLDGNTVTDNGLGSGGGQGILLAENAHHILVTGNLVSANHGDGIELTGGTHDVLILDNQLDGNTLDGILLTAKSHDNVIAQNEFDANDANSAELTDRAHDNLIIDNQVDANALDGILLTAKSHDNVIAQNEFDANGANGVELTDRAHDNLIIDNQIENNALFGVLLTRGAHDNRIDDNQVAGNGSGGIQSAAGAHDNRVSGDHDASGVLDSLFADPDLVDDLFNGSADWPEGLADD